MGWNLCPVFALKGRYEIAQGDLILERQAAPLGLPGFSAKIGTVDGQTI
jgi:hypothetical protein